MQSASSCAALLLQPCCETFYSLRQRLSTCDAAWLLELLRGGGLTRLLETLELFGTKRASLESSSVSDSIWQLDCVACVREILNQPVGLRYVIERPQLITTLVLGECLEI